MSAEARHSEDHLNDFPIRAYLTKPGPFGREDRETFGAFPNVEALVLAYTGLLSSGIFPDEVQWENDTGGRSSLVAFLPQTHADPVEVWRFRFLFANPDFSRTDGWETKEDFDAELARLAMRPGVTESQRAVFFFLTSASGAAMRSPEEQRIWSVVGEASQELLQKLFGLWREASRLGLQDELRRLYVDLSHGKLESLIALYCEVRNCIRRAKGDLEPGAQELEALADRIETLRQKRIDSLRRALSGDVVRDSGEYALVTAALRIHCAQRSLADLRVLEERAAEDPDALYRDLLQEALGAEADALHAEQEARHGSG